MRRRIATAAGLGLLAAGALVARADTLLRVRVDATGAVSEPADLASLSERLRARGYDVVPTVVPTAASSSAVEIVVSEAEAEALRQSGYAVEVVARGMPAEASETWSKYPRLAEVLARLRLVESLHPALVELVDLTEDLGAPPTFEGRHIHALKISDNVDSDEGDEPAILIAALHARELVTPVIALEAIDRLVAGYGEDPVITRAVEQNQIWIAPVWNPDGYEYVFTDNNLWRKNRRPFESGIGVDLNRNFPFGWHSKCAGDTSPASFFFKGPSPASEPETQAMLALTDALWFAKVLDFHSLGREVVWGSPCSRVPFEDLVGEEAEELSHALGYHGATRKPRADGQLHEWQLARLGTLSFLVETQTEWQPSYEDALAEADLVWPGILWMLAHPISVSGRVVDACDGAPLAAAIAFHGVEIENGEAITSGGSFGRYHATLPVGMHTLLFAAEGYWPESHVVDVTPTSAEILNVALVPSSPGPCDGLGAFETPASARGDPPEWGCGCESGSSPSGLAPLLFAALWLRPRRRG